MARSSRLRPRFLAIVLLLLIVGGVLLWRSLQPPQGTIQSLVALDERRAVVTLSGNTEQDGSWIAVLDAAEGLTAWRRLPGRPSTGSSLVVSPEAGLAFVYVQTGAGAQLLALSVPDLELRWKQPGVAREAEAGGELLVTATHLLELQHDRHAVTGRDPRTGAVTWTAEVDDLPTFDPVDDRLLVHAGKRTTLIDARSGAELASVERRGEGCRVGQVFYFLSPAPEQPGPQLRSLQLPGGIEKVVAQALPQAALFPARGCGVRNGELVMRLGVKSEQLLYANLATGESRLKPLGLDRGRADLISTGAIVRQHPEWRGFSGELPRFVPLAAAGTDAEGGKDFHRLAVLDLDRGAVVSQGRDLDPDGFPRLHKRGSLFYLQQGEQLATFDGEAGAFIAAVRTARPTETLPAHFSSKALWLLRRGPNGDELAVLDARTLEPLQQPTLRVERLADEAAAELGLPVKPLR